MPSFNLIVEPWIPVTRMDRSQGAVSLKELFEQAESIRRIACDRPPETAALLRLALAILIDTEQPQKKSDWKAIWRDRQGYFNKAIAYLGKHERLFDLYDAERPFAQHPSVPESDGSTNQLALDRAAGNEALFFDHRPSSVLTPIDSASAARGLLATHAFGGSHGKARNLKNESWSMYAGPLCARVAATLEGSNLGETLLLNLEYQELGQNGLNAGTPAWRRPVTEGANRSRVTTICDLYTRTTRHAKLKPSQDGKWCLGVTLYMGDGILVEKDETPVDPMIPLRQSQKKLVPLRLDPERALWRSAHSLLATSSEQGAQPLRSVRQLKNIVNEEDDFFSPAIGVRVMGVAGEAQGPVTELWRDESLPFSLSLVKEDGRFERLRSKIEAAEKTADNLRFWLRRFCAAYLNGLGGAADPKDVAALADELCHSLSPFWIRLSSRGEILALGEEHGALDADAWTEFLRRQAREVRDEIVDGVNAEDLRRYYALGKAHR